MTDQNLIPMEEVSIELFTTDKRLRTTLDAIKQEVSGVVFNTDTDKERKECIALASKVTRSKTAIEKAGKDYAAEISADVKAKLTVINGLRKESREFLTDLAANVRMPVTLWEEEQEKAAQTEADAAELKHAEIEAWDMNELHDKLQIVAEQEAKLAKALAEQAEERRLEELAKEATEKAADDAREEIRLANVRADNAAREERERLERIEKKRIAQEEADALKAKLASEDRQHRQTVNRAVLAALVDNGIEEETAMQVIRLIASGRIPQLKIGY